MRHSKWLRVISALLASLLLVVNPLPFCLEASAWNDGTVWAGGITTYNGYRAREVACDGHAMGVTLHSSPGGVYIAGSQTDYYLYAPNTPWNESVTVIVCPSQGHRHNTCEIRGQITVTVPGSKKVACATPSPTITKASSTSAAVSWSSITGASQYTVYYGTTSACSSSTTVWGTSYTISGVTAGSTIYAKVAATGDSANGYTDSSTSSVVSVDLITPLSAPSPSVTANSQTQITVSWSSISHASSYTVAYGTTSACSSGSFTVTGTSKSITGLSANTTYYVKVIANTSEVGYTSSGYSSVKSVTTPKIVLGAPALNTITITNSNELVIEFSKVTNANQYIIEYSTDSTFANKQTMTVSS